MHSRHILATGLKKCYDEDGLVIDCHNSGQDGEYQPGVSWPQERFKVFDNEMVQDKATNLIWSRDCCPSEFPLQWQEGLTFIRQLNDDKWHGRDDWRMPNRRELRSLIDHGEKKPPLTRNYPFTNLFQGWFWTSTTAAIATAYAWHVHFAGGRMFYGNKDGYYWVWPVSGKSDILIQTGADTCFTAEGVETPCQSSGQDAEHKSGVGWPESRFIQGKDMVFDTLTLLIWHRQAMIRRKAATWNDALKAVSELNRASGLIWRVPSINELESLVDAALHSPALPAKHPFTDVAEAYWSSTTSSFETDWAYVLYMLKGAVGVGFKKNRDFAVWPVLSIDTEKIDVREFLRHNGSED